MRNSSKQQDKMGRHASVRKKNRRVPSLRLHTASGQAYVVLNGKAVYCGKHGTPEAEQRYYKAIAERLAAGWRLPVEPDTITIKEILSRFWVHAAQYYRTVTDGRVKELEQFRLAFRPFKELYAETRAADFGPRALKTLRKRMIEMGWCRPYINKQINRIRHVFKWAASDELVPGEVLRSLQAAPGLRKGRGDAPEPEPVKPVPMEMVEAVQPFVFRQVWAMIQLQLLTGARAGELTRMRPCDIDRSGDVWVYQPSQHKTAHHGLQRRIYLGPKLRLLTEPARIRPGHAHDPKFAVSLSGIRTLPQGL